MKIQIINFRRYLSRDRTLYYISTIFLIFLAISISPAPTMAGTFAQYMSYFYRTSPNIQGAEEDIKAQNESYVQAREAFGPQISLSFEADYQQARVDQANIFGQKYTSTLAGRTSTSSLDVTQHLFSGGRLPSHENGAQADVLSARETARLAVSQAFRDAIQAFADVVRDEAVVTVTGVARDLLEKDLSDMQEKFRAGAATISDRAEILARLAAARTQVASAEGQLQQSRAAFLGVIGQEPTDLESPPPLPALPDNREMAVAAAMADNPSLKQAVFDEVSARAKVAVAKASFSPDISLQLSAQSVPLYQYVPGMQDRNLTAGIVVQMPVFSSGALISKVRQAEAQDRSARLKVEATRRSVVRTAEQEFAARQAAVKTIHFLSEQVQADRVAYESLNQQFRSGLISTIDLLNSEQELYNAEVSLASARHDEVLAEADLLAASGRLDADTLIPDALTRKPEADFRKLRIVAASLPTTLLARGVDGLAAIGDLAPTHLPTLPLEPSIVPDTRSSSIYDIDPSQIEVSNPQKGGKH